MPNWSDDEGRYWWTRPDGRMVEIPHPPFAEAGCRCQLCSHEAEQRQKIAGKRTQ